MKRMNELEEHFIDKPERNSQDSLKQFFIGLILFGVSIFLIMQYTNVSMSWYSWRLGGFGVPTGVIMIPILIGIGLLFYNSKSIIGWIVIILGIVFVVITLILSFRISFARTNLMVFVFIFGTFFAGSGLLLRSMFPSKTKKRKR